MDIHVALLSRFPRRTTLGLLQTAVARDFYQVIGPSSGRSSHAATSSSRSPLEDISSPAVIGSASATVCPLSLQITDSVCYVGHSRSYADFHINNKGHFSKIVVLSTESVGHCDAAISRRSDFHRTLARGRYAVIGPHLNGLPHFSPPPPLPASALLSLKFKSRAAGRRGAAGLAGGGGSGAAEIFLIKPDRRVSSIGGRRPRTGVVCTVRPQIGIPSTCDAPTAPTPHTANDRRCPVFRREAWVRGLKVPPQERPWATRGQKGTASSGTRGNHGTGTTGRGHRPYRTAAHRLSPPGPDSAYTAETEKGQEGEKEGKKDATTATTTAAATNRTESDRSPPRGKSEKSRSTPEYAALPNHATETATPTTPTTAEADRETTTHPHHIRPGPGGGQSKSSHVRDDKDTHHNTPLNQDWPGSDTGHCGRPDTRGDVLNLRIIFWNPGGIIGKTRELRDLAQLEDAHIILLGETKLPPEQELRIPNFFAYQRDGISARGPAYRGTAILIRRDIMHEAEQLTDFESMCSIGIRVRSSEQEIRLFAAYRPPGTKMCVQDIHAIFQEQTPTLIIGDLNAKHKAWGLHSISRAGRLLMEDAERQGYEVLGPDTPTHVPTDIRHRPDVLDIVIGHKMRRPMHVEVMYGMDT
ncbi:Probable RNA-directed DNA polymerase from transposon BS [Eumeta japonica]|uniref:Probable RNA-directed DNA polymerase from transposon BS n=1 Tax=Eumeta variegata TaxID=151549 RepID=A0A4C1WF65_EUMVA|nr:Probable RNA-directed DNA polymerase from transposon BS [Eumeta japonica]